MTDAAPFADFHIGAHIQHVDGVGRYIKIDKIRVHDEGAGDSRPCNVVNIRTGALSWIIPSVKVREID